MDKEHRVRVYRSKENLPLENQLPYKLFMAFAEPVAKRISPDLAALSPAAGFYRPYARAQLAAAPKGRV